MEDSLSTLKVIVELTLLVDLDQEFLLTQVPCMIQMLLNYSPILPD